MTREQFISKWGNRGGRPLFDASVEFTNDLDEFLSEDINLLEARTRRKTEPGELISLYTSLGVSIETDRGKIQMMVPIGATKKDIDALRKAVDLIEQHLKE